MSIKRRTTLPTSLQVTNKSPSQKASGANTKRATEKIKDKLNIRYKNIQTSIDENTKKKRLKKVARKTIRIATKVKDPKTFEQK